jgi:hypothetical protein
MFPVHGIRTQASKGSFVSRLDSDVTPNAWTNFSTRRVDTPSR